MGLEGIAASMEQGCQEHGWAGWATGIDGGLPLPWLVWRKARRVEGGELQQQAMHWEGASHLLQKAGGGEGERGGIDR